MLLTLVTLSVSQAAQASPQEVEAAFQELQRAIRARDIPALERLVHPQFEMLHGGGNIEGYRDWLGIARAGTLGRQRQETSEFDVKISIIGPVASRSSLVRFRNLRQQEDLWVRGTAMFLREGDRWRQIRHQSSLLYQGPTTEASRLDDYVGAYDIPGRDGFRVSAEGAYLTLHWACGARLVLIPAGPDRFGAGVGSFMQFTRGADGTVAAAHRGGREGPPWWTAARRREP